MLSIAAMIRAEKRIDRYLSFGWARYPTRIEPRGSVSAGEKNYMPSVAIEMRGEPVLKKLLTRLSLGR